MTKPGRSSEGLWQGYTLGPGLTPLCDCFFVFIGKCPFSPGEEVALPPALPPSLSLSLKPEEAVFCLFPPLSPAMSLQSEWQEGVPGARRQCLAHLHRKLPIMALICWCNDQKHSHHQGLKPRSSEASLHPGPHKSLFYTAPGLPQAPWQKSDKGPLCWDCQSPLLGRELENSNICQDWDNDK